MVIISVYFDYAKNRASSGPGKAKPISNEEIAEVKGHRDRIARGVAQRGGDTGTLGRYSRISLAIYHREY